MKKKYRLKKDKDFKRIIAHNHVQKNRFFVIYYLDNKLGYPRVGISVSRKLGGAVIRNRIRRQVRAMIDQEIKLDESNDLLVIVRNEFLGNAFDDNCAKFKQLIDAIRRLTHE